MSGHTEQCVKRYLELAQLQMKDLKPVTTPCLDDHQLAPEDFVNKGKLHAVASRAVLKCLFVARMNRPDTL